MFASLQLFTGGRSWNGPTGGVNGLSGVTLQNGTIVTCNSEAAVKHIFCVKMNNQDLKCFNELPIVPKSIQFELSTSEINQYFQKAASLLPKIKQLPNFETEPLSPPDKTVYCEYKKKVLCIADEDHIVAIGKLSNPSEKYNCNAFFKRNCLPVK